MTTAVGTGGRPGSGGAGRGGVHGTAFFAARQVAELHVARGARHAVVALDVVVDAELGRDARQHAIAGDLGQRLERGEVVRILDRGDQLAVLDDQRHALVLERRRRLEQPHGRAFRALQHRAGRDRDAELEAQVHGQRLEIDEAELHQHRPEPPTVSRLVHQSALELGRREAAVADEHLPELHEGTVSWPVVGQSFGTCYHQGVRVLCAALVAVVSCKGRSDAPAPVPPASPRAPVPAVVEAPAPAEAPVFPDTARSLELTRTSAVRLEPGGDEKRIGTIAIDTRVAWTRTQKAKGCDKPWVEVVPHGWICGDFVKPSDKPPYGQEVPLLARGEIVPGTYGKVTAPQSSTYKLEKPEPIKKKPKKPKKPRKKGGKDKKAPVDDDAPTPEPASPPLATPKMVEDRPLVGSINVRDYDDVTMDGKQYWKIAQKDNQYVLKSAISVHQPSKYSGTRLGDDTGYAVPFAFVWPRAGYLQAWTYAKSTGAGVMRQLSARTGVPVLETLADKTGKPLAYRIGESEWMMAADVRVFTPAPPPALLGKGERWIDVDVDTQILVAYEGDTAVYSTMVSTGGRETATETGVYRMWVKESEADMKGLNGEDPYSVATVPWTQFFSPEKGLALHTAYWHDQFGVRRSHGCVNLAPRDARWLYFWSDPQVPPGWTMAAGVVEAPGSVVRVRSKEDPSPAEKGYAKKVLEARQQNQPVK